MIIVEGADGAGKTTLVRQLVSDYRFQVLPKPSNRLLGQTCTIDAWEEQLPADHHMSITDRHPTVSSLIYDQILGRGFYNCVSLHRLYRELESGEHYMIVVDPGYPEAHRRAKSQPQMAGVLTNYSKVYSAYHRFYSDLNKLSIPYITLGYIDYMKLEDYLESS